MIAAYGSASDVTEIRPGERKMKQARTLFYALSLMVMGLATTGAIAAIGSGTFRTIQNSGGGTIVFGALTGQMTPQAALNATLKQVDTSYGNQPQLGKVLQNKAGTVWESFFTVNDKAGGTAMTGMVIVYAPQSGTAAGAYLIDTSARFPQSVNSMFQTLVQQVTGGASASAPASSGSAAASGQSGPAQKLTPVVFPDGSGSMGLPPGWKLTRAQLGDASASGPNGEMLRFGLTIPILDPTNPQSRGLMGRNGPPGNFLAIPYNSDAATLFTQASAQIARKMRTQAPAVTIQNVRNLPLSGGRNFMVYGSVDTHNGQGPQAMIAQMIVTTVQMMGSYQMTVFEITAPPQVMVSEAATISEIYPNYSRNTAYVNAVANQQIQQGLAQEKQFISTVNAYTDSSDRMTAGMSNLLRGQTVIRDTENGGHATTSDGLADLLTQSNPNLFETVPTSQYIRGIDY
jgi:hypothetical protein